MNQGLKQLARTALVSSVLYVTSLFTSTDAGTSIGLFFDSSVQKEREQAKLAKAFFLHYNHDVKDMTVARFMNVSDAYEFTKNDTLFLHCIHQICLESRADQSAQSGGGAIGMAQIVPTTAFDVLHKISDEDWATMESLGAQSIAWAKNGEYSYHVVDSVKKAYIAYPLRKKAKKWLSNENNNLILWGHIMRKNLAVMPTMESAFLRYHLGCGGVEKFKHSAKSHEYLKLMGRIGLPSKKRKRGAA